MVSGSPLNFGTSATVVTTECFTISSGMVEFLSASKALKLRVKIGLVRIEATLGGGIHVTIKSHTFSYEEPVELTMMSRSITRQSYAVYQVQSRLRHTQLPVHWMLVIMKTYIYTYYIKLG